MRVEEELWYNHTSISRKLDVADLQAAYDDNVKWLLSEKWILANILVYAVPEFRGMTVEKVLPLIDGKPQVAEVFVAPGESNASAITGENTEDGVPGEGKVVYDIRFHAWAPNGKGLVKLIIDLEAQKKYFPGYNLVTRGVVYGARLISAQMGTEFSDSHYDDVKKVYSIWICLDTPQYAENTITEYSMEQHNLVGDFPKDKSRYDILSVIMICLSEQSGEAKNKNKLLGLLEALLSGNIPIWEKKTILEQEYQIPMTQKIDRRVNEMCNLSEAILERGVERGMEQGQISGESRMLLLIQKMSINDEAHLISRLSEREFLEEMYKKYNIEK